MRAPQARTGLGKQSPPPCQAGTHGPRLACAFLPGSGGALCEACSRTRRGGGCRRCSRPVRSRRGRAARAGCRPAARRASSRAAPSTSRPAAAHAAGRATWVHVCPSLQAGYVGPLLQGVAVSATWGCSRGAAAPVKGLAAHRRERARVGSPAPRDGLQAAQPLGGGLAVAQPVVVPACAVRVL